MTAALHAEWTKLRTVAEVRWWLLAAAVLTAGLSAVAVATTSELPGGGRQLDLTEVTLTGVYLGQAVVVVLAVGVMSSEYGTRMIQSTLAAVPRRSAVLAAKAVVVTGVVAAAATVGVLGSLAAGWIFLPRNGFTEASGFRLPSLSEGPTVRAAVGTVLYLVLVALLSLGVATMVREAAVACGLVLALLYLFPLLVTAVSDPDWQRHLRQIGPMTAGLSIQKTIGLDSLPIDPWPGLGVLGLWAAVALGAGAVLLCLRDA
jgi:ABC-2 type transport system permease protein